MIFECHCIANSSEEARTKAIQSFKNEPEISYTTYSILSVKKATSTNSTTKQKNEYIILIEYE